MKKVLLSLVALFALGLTNVRAASDIELGLTASDLQDWWGATWDADSKTMTCEEAWKGLSWYWYTGLDVTDYTEVQIDITPASTGKVQVVIQYYGDDDENSNATTEVTEVTADEEITLKCTIDHSKFEAIGQLAIQAGENYTGTIVINSAVIKADPSKLGTSIDITDTENQANWEDEDKNDSGTITVNDDGTATLNFTREFGGLGWTNWYPYWDLSNDYAIVVEYSDLTETTADAKAVGTTDEDEAESAYIQLFVQSAKDYASATVADKEVTGKIVYLLGENSDLDYTETAQIVIQSNIPCSVTINSITAYTEEEYEAITSEEEEGEGEEEGTGEETTETTTSYNDYFTSLDFEGDNTAWTICDYQDIGVEANTGSPSDVNGAYYFFANYGNAAYGDGAFPASTTLISQTSKSELPAGKYTVSGRICVGDNGCEGTIELYAAAGADEAITKLYRNGTENDYESGYISSAEIELAEAAYVTIGIRTNSDWLDTGYLWLYADDFNVEGPEHAIETGITSVPAVTATGNGAIYNLAGQRVNAGTKGLLIIDGKKVLVK